MEEILSLRIYKTIFGILGILGNGLVCAVICKVSVMQTRTNAFIFHQAVIDFLGSTMILLQSELPLPDPLPDNALGWFLCHVWLSNFVLFFVFVTSTFNLLTLTLERYFAIVHPFKYQAVFSKHPRLKVSMAIALCWIVGATIKSYLMTIFEIQNGTCYPIPGSKAVGLVTAVLEYVVPVAVMLFAYIRTSVELKRGAARVGPAPADRGQVNAPSTGIIDSLLQARRNTFKTLLIVFTTFIVCWTPNELIFLMFNLGYPLKFNEWFYLLSVAMVATNSGVNPVIYAFKYRQFRNGLREMFCRRRGRVSDVESLTGTTPQLLAPKTDGNCFIQKIS